MATSIGPSSDQLNISIIGLGVIGGSLGMAIAQNIPHAIVTGYDEPGVLKQARKRGAIHVAAPALAAAVRNADIVFLCTPISSILSLLPRIARYVQPQTIVTDVGSVKGAVQSVARKTFRKKGIFVGGHPMAGSEGSGIAHADPLLFQNAVYVLCPDRHKRASYRPLVDVIKALGARLLLMDAGQHDRAAAVVSHLPQLLAVAMMTMAIRENNKDSSMLQLAAGGFRDITRIASSPFPMWKDILSGNAPEIRRALREFKSVLGSYDKDLAASKLRPTGRRFETAKHFRDAIPRSSKGFLHPLHDVFVWVNDTPGVLATMTQILFREQLNIKDIELLKIREGRGGTFRLSFDTAEMAARARVVLRSKKFRVE
ncbi:MAG: prephenate dehydrogenase [Ignavibacteriales bacterium]|nr:prephenate dehydrogenase [Ignavibacteriales bacterium]